MAIVPLIHLAFHIAVPLIIFSLIDLFFPLSKNRCSYLDRGYPITKQFTFLSRENRNGSEAVMKTLLPTVHNFDNNLMSICRKFYTIMAVATFTISFFNILQMYVNVYYTFYLCIINS